MATDVFSRSNALQQPQQQQQQQPHFHPPVSSFGILCFRRRPGASRIEYLMVQRKDSLAYVEFIRGKYNVQVRAYLLRLLSNMTRSERERIRTSEFDQLWHGFWQSDNLRSFMKEYDQSKHRFESLRRGYGYHAPEPSFFSLETALDQTRSEHEEPEFGFPKGRRNVNESDLQCALREFSEESGIGSTDIRLWGGCQNHEELFTGSNNVLYRHVYYVAELRRTSRAMFDVGVKPSTDPVQMREVRAVGWFDANGVLSRIRAHNVERIELFEGVHRSLESLESLGSLGSLDSKPALNPFAPPFHLRVPPHPPPPPPPPPRPPIPLFDFRGVDPRGC